MMLAFKKILLFSLFLIIIPYGDLKAQEWEFGASGGSSGYMGDINQDNIFKFNDWTAGALIKYNLNPTWGMKFTYSHVNLRGDDANSSNSEQRARNIRFHTPLDELALVMEFNFFKFNPARHRNAYSPYVFGGIGVSKFTPKGDFQDKTYSLADFRTEQNLTGNSQEDETYETNTLVIPFGAGFKYSLNGTWAIGVELGYRLALTDYLDDVSGVYAGRKSDAVAEYFRDPSVDKIGDPGIQRGDGRPHDSYMSAQIVFTYTLFNCACPVW